MRLDVVRLFVLADAGVRALPEPVARAAFDLVAIGAWAARVGGVRQLERNLSRVRPDVGRAGLLRLSLAGMRAYMRYYCESFRLPALGPDDLAARVRATGDGAIREALTMGSAVLALGHTGNWDLAGAWATKFLGPVVTVAEHLEPEEIFQGFLEFRTSLGMTIIPLEKDGSTFRELLRHTRGSASVVPLLADRDLSRTGVDVDLLGHRARFAPGPAALALATGRPLFVATIRHERLRGARRRAAGTGWGIAIEFVEVWPGSAPGAPRPSVAELTQRWVDAVASGIAAHPDQWHMLQKVFLADLDPDRLARQAAPRPTPDGGTATPPDGRGNETPPDGRENETPADGAPAAGGR